MSLKHIALLLLMCVFAVHCAMSAESSLLEDDVNYNGAQGAGGSSSDINFTASTGPQFDGNFGGSGPCYFEKIGDESIDIKMLIVLDRSGSMGGFKWNAAVDALIKFFKNPKVSGTGVALTFFPFSHTPPPYVPPPYISDPYCIGSEYNPPDILMGILPGHFKVLHLALQNESPKGSSTPLYGALEGSYEWALEYKKQNPLDTLITLLVSDGDPTGCGNGKNTLSQLTALSEHAHDNGVDTYTIAMPGANVAVLDALAFTGGSDSAVDITYDPTLMYTKIDEIRNSFRCEYNIPTGYSFDFTNVSVEYKSSLSLPDWQIPNVTDANECAKTLGWYYNNNSNPTKIIICDIACNVITADPEPEVQYAFGCEGSHIIK